MFAFDSSFPFPPPLLCNLLSIHTDNSRLDCSPLLVHLLIDGPMMLGK